MVPSLSGEVVFTLGRGNGWGRGCVGVAIVFFFLFSEVASSALDTGSRSSYIRRDQCQ